MLFSFKVLPYESQLFQPIGGLGAIIIGRRDWAWTESAQLASAIRARNGINRIEMINVFLSGSFTFSPSTGTLNCLLLETKNRSRE